MFYLVRGREKKKKEEPLQKKREEVKREKTKRMTDTDTQMAFTFVTGNAHKLKELQEMLGERVFSIDLDLPELQGDPEQVAYAKCKAAQLHVKGPVLVEDSSLCFNALGGMPGVFVKWFLEKTGLHGLVNLLMPYSDKSAYGQCIYALSDTSGIVHLFAGRRNGHIVSPRGPTHFGWDAIFQPEGSSETYAEMSKETKNRTSDRAIALLKLTRHLENKSRYHEHQQRSISPQHQ